MAALLQSVYARKVFETVSSCRVFKNMGTGGGADGARRFRRRERKGEKGSAKRGRERERDR